MRETALMGSAPTNWTGSSSLRTYGASSPPRGEVVLAATARLRRPHRLLESLRRCQYDMGRTPAPLVVIGRRDVLSNNSWMHNLPVLAKGPMRCTALAIHRTRNAWACVAARWHACTATRLAGHAASTCWSNAARR